jgi:hypothetical protein
VEILDPLYCDSMSNKGAKAPERIRWPTAFLLLVLATVGFIVFWQFVLEGRLSQPAPEQIVREFLRLGLPHPDTLQISEVTVLDELPNQQRYVRSAAVRVRFRAQDDLGKFVDFDKVFVVIGDEVKSAQDWTPELQSQVHELIVKLQQQK